MYSQYSNVDPWKNPKQEQNQWSKEGYGQVSK